MPNERLYLFIIFCPDHDYREERIVQERDFEETDWALSSDPSMPEFRWYEIVRAGAHSEEGIVAETEVTKPQRYFRVDYTDFEGNKEHHEGKAGEIDYTLVGLTLEGAEVIGIHFYSK